MFFCNILYFFTHFVLAFLCFVVYFCLFNRVSFLYGKSCYIVRGGWGELIFIMLNSFKILMNFSKMFKDPGMISELRQIGTVRSPPGVGLPSAGVDFHVVGYWMIDIWSSQSGRDVFLLIHLPPSYFLINPPPVTCICGLQLSTFCYQPSGSLMIVRSLEILGPIEKYCGIFEKSSRNSNA